MYQMRITDAAEVRALLGAPLGNQARKVIDHIDDHCRSWIARTPFIVISSINGAGAMDVSPKGDLPGFVKVLDPRTLAIPDRPGNHRADTLLNVIENPSVGIVFMVPGRREVVRVSGTASIVRDPDLLDELAVNEKAPAFAIVVRVREAFFHCGKSVIRSGLWEPKRWGPTDGLPTYGQAIKDHASSTEPVETIQARIDRNDELLY